MDPEFLTVKEAAALLRLRPACVARWIRQGRLPAYRVPGTRGYRIRRSELYQKLAEDREQVLA